MNRFYFSGACKKDSSKGWDMVLATHNDEIEMQDIMDVDQTMREQGIEDPFILFIQKLAD